MGKFAAKIVRGVRWSHTCFLHPPRQEETDGKGWKSRRSCTCTTCISKFLLLYILYTPCRHSPQKPNQGLPNHPGQPSKNTPNPRTNPNWQSPGFAQTKSHIPYIKVLPRMRSFLPFYKSRVLPFPCSPVPLLLRFKEDRAAKRACWFRRGSRRRGRG